MDICVDYFVLGIIFCFGGECYKLGDFFNVEMVGRSVLSWIIGVRKDIGGVDFFKVLNFVIFFI